MVLKDRKTHGAGVTAIIARPDTFSLSTGSYDYNLRIVDLRNEGASWLGKSTSEVVCGG
ncbi:hypothetical protein BGX38DRAFT_1217314 [Terfezia claveryi]|nr:hypothetical protein BGX38DRAFT_1217314 [Terfezia claveryi]